MSDMERCGQVSAADMGLPSTTAVPSGRGRLPKEGFYRGMDIAASLRRRFVEDVESFTMLAQINERSTGIPSDGSVDAVFVLGLALKQSKPPVQVMEHIARFYGERTGRKGRILFLCAYEGECRLAVFREADVSQGLMEGRLHVSEPVDFRSCPLRLADGSLERIWDGVCAQVILGEVNPERVDRRIAVRVRRTALLAELERLEKAHAKARQIAKRNELWARLRRARLELEMLDADESH